MKTNAGLSLVEILVAMIILGFGITMVMRMLPDSNAATTRARNMTKATNLAQEKLEQLMSAPFDDTDLTAGAHPDPTNPINDHFNRSWTVQDDNPYSGMKRVVVRVNYPTSRSDSTITIDSILSPRW